MGSMPATTKRELVRRISEETGLGRTAVRQVVQSFLDDIVDELAKGRRIEFRDFGVFDVVHRKARSARNPRTGESIEVPPKTVVHFRQGRQMKERVGALAGRPPGKAGGGGGE
jgi:nucleoid DNA-binding protein